MLLLHGYETQYGLCVCVSVYFLYLADIGSTSILTLLTQTEQLIECFTASTHIIEALFTQRILPPTSAVSRPAALV